MNKRNETEKLFATINEIVCRAIQEHGKLNAELIENIVESTIKKYTLEEKVKDLEKELLLKDMGEMIRKAFEKPPPAPPPPPPPIITGILPTFMLALASLLKAFLGIH